MKDTVDFYYYDTLDSTNTEARRKINENIKMPAVFIADKQTSGRGRRGKTFFSEGGLYMSILLDTAEKDIVLLTTLASVAVAEAIEETANTVVGIKWVNDIFIDNKTVCGILTEAVSDFEANRVQAVIIGIGINLTTDVFPAEISEIAGSVGSVNRCYLAAEIFKRLKAGCEVLSQRSFMDDYRKYSLVIGKEVEFSRNGIDYIATARNIADDGSLLVITKEGEEITLNCGEISVRLSND